MNKLVINIKKKYFNEILNGTKKEEFRKKTKFWETRILNREYTHVVFRNGYKKNAPTITLRYLGYDVKNLQRDFFGKDATDLFVLKLGEVCDL